MVYYGSAEAPFGLVRWSNIVHINRPWASLLPFSSGLLGSADGFGIPLLC